MYILTNRFPYGNSESYLKEELLVYKQLKLDIVLVPLNVVKGDVLTEKYLDFKVLNFSWENYAKSKIKFRNKFYLMKVYLSDLCQSGSPKYIIENWKKNYSLLLRLFFKANLIEKYIKEQSVKPIIYTYWCNELAIVGGFLKRKLGVKFISRGHGFDIFKEQTKFNYIPFRKFQLEMLDKLFPVSKKGELEMKRHFPKFSNKIETAYLGVRDNGLNPFDKDRLIICTCSYVRGIKRLGLLVNALNRCTSEIKWIVIGNGPELENLKTECKNLPINITVEFMGFLNSEELNAFYKKSSISVLVSVSSSEGLPVSMMEAESYGIPIISTDVGGCNEIVTDETGILIPKNFKESELAQILDSFRSTKYFLPLQRDKIKMFWENKFNSKSNYTNFVNNIYTLN